MAGSLDLNDCARTKVFRKLVEFVENDPTIRRVVKPASIRSWKGTPLDSADFSTAIAPCLRFTPISGPDAFWSPGAMRGPLFLNVELLVKGSNVDDVMNLWQAVVRAIYPAAPSATNVHILELQRAGAYDGLPTFTQPAFDPSPADNFFWATGQIKIDVNNQLLEG